MYYSKITTICQYRRKVSIILAFLAFFLFFLMYGLALAQSAPLNKDIDEIEINEAAALLKLTIDKINQAIEKEITLFEKEALANVSQAKKNAITADFLKTRKELSAIFREEFIRSGKSIAFRMAHIDPDIRTIENDISSIYKEEIAAGCDRAKCSAEEIQKIAKAYIIKKYITIPKLSEYSIFIKDTIQLLDKNDTEIVHMINDTKKEIGTTFLGWGDNLRRKVIQLLTQASGQLNSGIFALNEVNAELITIETGIKENSISAKDITVALARIKKDMEVFQKHRRVDGTIDQGIGENILQILRDKELEGAITAKNKELKKQRKPPIILQEYITSTQQLIGQAAQYINGIDKYAQSDEIQRLYEVLPTRVAIDQPLVFPLRKPPMPLSIPNGVSPDTKPRTGIVPPVDNGGALGLPSAEEAKRQKMEENILKNDTVVYVLHEPLIKRVIRDPKTKLYELLHLQELNVVVVADDGRGHPKNYLAYCNGELCFDGKKGIEPRYDSFVYDFRETLSRAAIRVFEKDENGKVVNTRDLRGEREYQKWLKTRNQTAPPSQPPAPSLPLKGFNRSADPFAQPPVIPQQTPKPILFTEPYRRLPDGRIVVWCVACEKLENTLNEQFKDFNGKPNWKKYITMGNPKQSPSGFIPCVIDPTGTEIEAEDCLAYLKEYIINEQKKERLAPPEEIKAVNEELRNAPNLPSDARQRIENIIHPKSP